GASRARGARRRGRRRARDLLRAPRGAAAGKPDPRDARGPARGRVRPQRGVRGARRGRGDGPARRGGRMSVAAAATRRRSLADATNARRLVDLVFRVREFGIVAVLALLVAATAIVEPRFVHLTNVQFILVDAT